MKYNAELTLTSMVKSDHCVKIQVSTLENNPRNHKDNLETRLGRGGVAAAALQMSEDATAAN